MFHELNASDIRFWLLATPGAGLVHEREKLRDAHEARTRLAWGGQYVLSHTQRPRAAGGGRTWTWELTDERYAALAAAMRLRAAAHGREPERW
jgi:hypothetical protein